jgi:DNA polymerase III epsilon subunit-like protein
MQNRQYATTFAYTDLYERVDTGLEKIHSKNILVFHNKSTDIDKVSSYLKYLGYEVQNLENLYIDKGVCIMIDKDLYKNNFNVYFDEKGWI